MSFLKRLIDSFSPLREDNGGKKEELRQAHVKAEELARRTRKIARENNLAAEIRKALGAG